MSGWDKQYTALKKKALGSETKDKWVPWVNGVIGDAHIEISVVHTAEPHGLLSLGWDGPHKIIVYDVGTGNNHVKRASRKLLHQRMMAIATTMSEELNKQFPKGIK